MIVEIELQTFYSEGDESRFFEGLRGNKAVKGSRGVGRNLLLTVDPKALNRDRLWDLISLLWRYGIPLRPLRTLASAKRFASFKDKRMYWYDELFGKIRSSGRAPTGGTHRNVYPASRR